MMKVKMVVSRELRVVPKGWRNEDCILNKDMPSVAGLPPEGTEIVAYETVTEGTPISPNFPNTPEGKLALVNHCAEHCPIVGENVDIETWAGILFSDNLAVFDIHERRVEISDDQTGGDACDDRRILESPTTRA